MAREQTASEGVGAGERWGARRDGSEIFLDRGPKHRRSVIGGFHSKGSAALDHERALLAAQAPLMHEALLAIMSKARECGYFEQSPYHPKVGCDCGECQGLRALALAEGGGRCILCGCTEFDACDVGCAWVDGAQLLCTAHPAKVIKAAKAFITKEFI